MRRNISRTSNIQFEINIEYFTEDNFDRINYILGNFSNKVNSITSNIIKPTVRLNINNVHKKIVFKQLPIRLNDFSFILIKKHSLKIYTKTKNDVINNTFIGILDSKLSNTTLVINSIFSKDSKLVNIKDFKLLKEIKFDEYNLNILTFLFKITNTFDIIQTYMYLGHIDKEYLEYWLEFIYEVIPVWYDVKIVY